jgi:outer membrane protein TolC
MRGVYPILAAVLLPVAIPAAALTLAEAQAILLRDNADLAVMRLEAEQAEYRIRESRAAWMPGVDAFSSYAFTSETPRLSLELPFPSPGGTSINRSLGDHDKVELGVDATLPIFTGFSRSNALAARKAEARAQEARIQAARNQLSLRLAALFYAWQLADAQAGFLGRTAEHARRIQAQLADFVKAGTAVRSRALAAEARAKSAEVERLAAESARDSLALEVLDFLGTGLGFESETVPGTGLGLERETAPGTDPGLEPDPGAIPSLPLDFRLRPDSSEPPRPDWELADATQVIGDGRRPEVRALEEGMRTARLNAKALAGQRLPQLHGMAGFRYANPGLDLAGDEFMAYGLAGLQLRWNLFDGLRNRQQRRQLGIQERVLAEQGRKLRSGWEKSMRTARLLHARGEAQLEAAKASLDAARAAAADLERQLELGLATEVELMEARNNEARAQWAMEQARTLQKLAVLQWRHAAGKELRF